MTTPKRNEAVATTRHEAGFEDGPIFHREEWMRLKDLPKGTKLFTGETVDALQGEVSRLRGLLTAWYAEESRYSPRQSPGHHHQIPGIWDSDNGDLAGKPCAKCALWAEIKTIANLEPPTDGR